MDIGIFDGGFFQHVQETCFSGLPCEDAYGRIEEIGQSGQFMGAMVRLKIANAPRIRLLPGNQVVLFRSFVRSCELLQGLCKQKLFSPACARGFRLKAAASLRKSHT
jgi:hypothetical protein